MMMMMMIAMMMLMRFCATFVIFLPHFIRSISIIIIYPMGDCPQGYLVFLSSNFCAFIGLFLNDKYKYDNFLQTRCMTFRICTYRVVFPKCTISLQGQVRWKAWDPIMYCFNVLYGRPLTYSSGSSSTSSISLVSDSIW